MARYDNISGSVIKFKKGDKKIYRSAILSENLRLLSELVKRGGVKSIIVLTNSKLFDVTKWADRERVAFSVLGGSQFTQILDFDGDLNSEDDIEKMRSKIASIIRLIANSEGAVLIHCLGGEHRTSLVFEVMQRCINKVGMPDIIQRYKCHTGWTKANKWGYRQQDIDFIESFPCSLIDDL